MSSIQYIPLGRDCTKCLKKFERPDNLTIKEKEDYFQIKLDGSSTDLQVLFDQEYHEQSSILTDEVCKNCNKPGGVIRNLEKKVNPKKYAVYLLYILLSIIFINVIVNFSCIDRLR